MSVPAPFVWRCLSGSTIAPFPHPAHRTGHADFPHPALEQDFTPSFACAAQLVQRYESLNGVLDAGFFRNQAETLRLYRLIATMDSTAPLPSLADQAPTWALASSLARGWGLNQLAERLAEKV
jgi:hypothetical protein